MPLNWDFIKPRSIKVYNYIGPGVNRQVADGIMNGVNLFVRQKLGLKPAHIELKDFDMAGDKAGNYLDIFITKNAISKGSVDRSKHLKGALVFATEALADARNYKDSKANISHLKNLRGAIHAYNRMAGLFNHGACNNEHCAFNYNQEDLDALAFLYHLNKKVPLCEKHNKWKY